MVVPSPELMSHTDAGVPGRRFSHATGLAQVAPVACGTAVTMANSRVAAAAKKASRLRRPVLVHLLTSDINSATVPRMRLFMSQPSGSAPLSAVRDPLSRARTALNEI